MSEKINEIVNDLEKLEKEGAQWLAQFVAGGRDALEEISDIRLYARDEISKRRVKMDSPRSAVYLHHLSERLRNLEVNMYGANMPLIEFFKSQKEFLAKAKLLTTQTILRKKNQGTQTRVSIQEKPDDNISKSDVMKIVNEKLGATKSEAITVEKPEKALESKKRNLNDTLTSVIERNEEEYLDLGLDLCEDRLEEYFEIDKPVKRIRIEKEEKVMKLPNETDPAKSPFDDVAAGGSGLSREEIKEAVARSNNGNVEAVSVPLPDSTNEEEDADRNEAIIPVERSVANAESDISKSTPEKPSLQSILKTIPGPSPKRVPILSWDEEMLKEEEERRAKIVSERKRLEAEERRAEFKAAEERSRSLTLDFQEKLPEVRKLVNDLGNQEFSWIQDDEDEYRVFYKDAYGELNFFPAKRIPERPSPYFEMNAIFDILPSHCTLAVYVGDQFNCETRKGWMVCQLDLTVYRSLISGKLLKTKPESWKKCEPEIEELQYERCREARFCMNTHITIWGCRKQAFQVAVGIVESHRNPFFDHKRIILGQQFLEDYLVGLDFLDDDLDDPEKHVCRLVFRTTEQKPKTWSTTIERKKSKW